GEIVPKLSGCPQQNQAGLRKQRTEVDHGTHAHKNQKWKELGLNACSVNYFHKSDFVGHAQVCEQTSEANRQKQHGFIFFPDRQVDQHKPCQDHGSVTPGESLESFAQVL